MLEVTQDELVMLAANEWRLHGNDEAGGGQQWHMPRQTLDMVRQPSFCRGVQNLFLDAIEGDGTALLSADMLYPDHSMREPTLQHPRRHFKVPLLWTSL